jgi:hypothetical protein
MSTITATGVIALSVVAALSGFGIEVPIWAVSIPPLVVATTVGILRLVVALKGPDNTGIDEALDRAETAIEDLADLAAKKASKP